MADSRLEARPRGPSPAWPVAALIALIWAEWPAIRTMIERWTGDPRYSHGVLVPAFAGYLLWRRRGLIPRVGPGSTWWGLAAIGLGVGLEMAGTLLFFGWLQGVALIPILAGVALLWGGPNALRWAGPSLGFLVFMVPLPYRVEVALGSPLQRIGTVASTYALQTLGLPAISEGNVIRLDDRASIAVVEACNGLGMLAAFACYATGAAMLMGNRDPLTRSIVLLSAAPLALVANVARITATGLVHSRFGGGAADLVFHDLAGWLMMPLALALLWAELGLLGALIVEDEPGPVGVALRRSLAGASPRPR